MGKGRLVMPLLGKGKGRVNLLMALVMPLVARALVARAHNTSRRSF